MLGANCTDDKGCNAHLKYKCGDSWSKKNSFSGHATCVAEDACDSKTGADDES